MDPLDQTHLQLLSPFYYNATSLSQESSFIIVLVGDNQNGLFIAHLTKNGNFCTVRYPIRAYCVNGSKTNTTTFLQDPHSTVSTLGYLNEITNKTLHSFHIIYYLKFYK